MNTVTDLTITMVSFNSSNVTRQALRSIHKYTQDLSFEVIVVDNGSDDGSTDMIEQEFSAVHLLRNSHNLGFGAAHNQAMRQSKGEYILVLNSDVEFLDNAAKSMIETLRAWPAKAGALGPRILNPDGSFAPSASYRQFPPRLFLGVTIVNHVFSFAHRLPLNWIRNKLGFLLNRFHGKFLLPTITERVEWVDGMAVMFSRDALEQVGLFDEQFFFDMEIGDLLYRMRKQRWEIIYDPEIAVVHLGGYSRKRNPRILRQSVKSMLIYYAKHRPDYVSFMKALYSGALWAKIQILAMTRKASDELELYRQIRKDLMGFSVDDAVRGQMIPWLPRT